MPSVHVEHIFAGEKLHAQSRQWLFTIWNKYFFDVPNSNIYNWYLRYTYHKVLEPLSSNPLMVPLHLLRLG